MSSCIPFSSGESSLLYRTQYHSCNRCVSITCLPNAWEEGVYVQRPWFVLTSICCISSSGAGRGGVGTLCRSVLTLFAAELQYTSLAENDYILSISLSWQIFFFNPQILSRKLSPLLDLSPHLWVLFRIIINIPLSIHVLRTQCVNYLHTVNFTPLVIVYFSCDLCGVSRKFCVIRLSRAWL